MPLGNYYGVMSDNNPSAPSSSSDQHDDRQQPYQQPQNPMGEGGDGTQQTPLYPDSSHYSQTPSSRPAYGADAGQHNPYQDQQNAQQPQQTFPVSSQWPNDGGAGAPNQYGAFDGNPGNPNYPNYPGNAGNSGYSGNPGYPNYPGYPGQQPYATPYGPNDRWNTLCIVGFALAFIIPVVGLILSIIALNQINKTGGKSRGLSIAGIIIGGISTVLTVIGIIFGFWIIGQTIKGIDTDSDSWSYCYGDSCDEDWDDSMNSTDEWSAADTRNSPEEYAPTVITTNPDATTTTLWPGVAV